MMTYRVLWTVLVLAGGAANLRTLADALRRRRHLRAAGLDGELALIANQGVRSEAVTMSVQCLLGCLMLASWVCGEPVLSGPRAFYAACGWTFVACSALLTFDSVLDVRDRRRLLSGPGPARGAPSPHAASPGAAQRQGTGSSGTSL